MIDLILYLIFHLLCGVLSAGLDNGYFKGRFPGLHYKRDVYNTYALGIVAGPIYLIGTILFLCTKTFKYGLSFK